MKNCFKVNIFKTIVINTIITIFNTLGKIIYIYIYNSFIYDEIYYSEELSD